MWEEWEAEEMPYEHSSSYWLRSIENYYWLVLRNGNAEIVKIRVDKEICEEINLEDVLEQDCVH